MKRWIWGVRIVGCAAIVCSAAASAWAQAAAVDTDTRPESLGLGLVNTAAFAVMGIVIAIFGFKLFDLVTKFHVEKEIFEKQNVAAAIVSAAMILGISAIVAAAVL